MKQTKLRSAGQHIKLRIGLIALWFMTAPVKVFANNDPLSVATANVEGNTLLYNIVKLLTGSMAKGVILIIAISIGFMWGAGSKDWKTRAVALAGGSIVIFGGAWILNQFLTGVPD